MDDSQGMKCDAAFFTYQAVALVAAGDGASAAIYAERFIREYY